MTVREALWDCQYCGKQGNLGRHKDCYHCGKSRPAATKFYLPADAAAIEDPRLTAQAELGPDWVCAFCGTSNGADVTNCTSCQAARDTDAQQQKVQQYAAGAAPKSGDMSFDEPAPSPEQPRQAAVRRPAGRRTALIAGGVALLFACLCVATAFLLLRTASVSAEVTGMSWVREVEIERQMTVEETGWELPAGARLLSESEAIQSYDQIIVGYETRSREVSEQVQVGSRTYVCGQEDLGNGFFRDVECSEPVYETHYRTETYEEPVYEQVPIYAPQYAYEIDRWVVVRTESAAAGDNAPYWPRSNLAADEREGARRGIYTVSFVDADGARHEMEMSEAEWSTYRIGMPVQLDINAFGQIESVSPD